jgi:hypothetical protein
MYPILVWYVKKMATDGGGGGVGGVTAMIERDIGPWFKSPKPGHNLF